MTYNLEDGIPSFVIEVDFLKGAKGDTGFSPRIEIASLTSAEYILKIVNEDGEFYTPNLKSDLNLDDYVKKEEGKGLSTNSFENEEKTKLQELYNYDDTKIRTEIDNVKNDVEAQLNQAKQDILDTLTPHKYILVPTAQIKGRHRVYNTMLLQSRCRCAGCLLYGRKTN